MSISISEARKQLFPIVKQVTEDRVHVEIESRSGNAVIMSADDFSAWQETIHLFRSPVNARRILDSYERVKSGQFEEHPLDLED